MNNYLHFFNNVCVYLGIHDWTIEFNGDNYCWKHKKTITIDLNYNGDIRQIILHEIAHIETARFSNQKHNPHYWKYLEHITKKFLKRGLDNVQLNHKKYMTKGIYSILYSK